MSRSTKVIVSVALLVAAALAGGWAWFLHGQPQGHWAIWSSALSGLAAFLTIPGLAIAVVTLRQSPDRGSDAPRPAGRPAAKTLVRGPVKAGRDAYVADIQYIDQRREDRPR